MCYIYYIILCHVTLCYYLLYDIIHIIIIMLNSIIIFKDEYIEQNAS